MAKAKKRRPSRGFSPDAKAVTNEQEMTNAESDSTDSTDSTDSAELLELLEVKRLCSTAQQALDDFLNGIDEMTVVKYVDRNRKEVFGRAKCAEDGVVRLVLDPTPMAAEFAALVWEAVDGEGSDPSECDVASDGWDFSYSTAWQ